MRFFGSKTRPEVPAHVGVPILVRIWQEDDVWNVSAFDLGVAAFGNNLEDAKKNFEEALDSHFSLLVDMDRAKATIARLKTLAEGRGFYESRMNVREIVSRFEVPSKMEACYA